MNEVYGIDPSAPANLEEFIQLMRLFGVGEGRFIGNFPYDWMSRFNAHVNSLSPIQQQKLIQMWLDGGRNCLVPLSGKYSEKMSWIENSLSIKDKVFKLIGSKGCAAFATPLNEALLSPNGFPDSRGAHINRTPSAYAEAVLPLMQTSPKIVLVDPYFKFRYLDVNGDNQLKLSKRHSDSLTALVKEALAWKKVEVFCIMISPKEALINDPNADTFESDLIALSEKCGAPDKFFEFGLLDSNDPLDRHLRYILGMKQGLRFDWGFDIDNSESGSTNLIEWMSFNTLERLLRRYDWLAAPPKTVNM